MKEAIKIISEKMLVRNFKELMLLLLRFPTFVQFACAHSKIGRSVPEITEPILLNSATSLARLIRSGQHSCKEIINAYIKRIEEVQPILNCVLDRRFKEALLEAEKVDEIVKSKELNEDEIQKKFPLLGVPFSTCLPVKGAIYASIRCDKIALSDAMPVRCFRDSGAIPLATTNLPTMGLMLETTNRFTGRTNNPYDTSRVVGGPSGADACLVAAAGSPIAVGVDVAGSSRLAAHFNGVFGHTVTYQQKFNQFLPMVSVGLLTRFAEDLPLMSKIVSPLTNFDLDTIDFAKPEITIYYFLKEYQSMIPSHIVDHIVRVVNRLSISYGLHAEGLEQNLFENTRNIWKMIMKTVNENQTAFDSVGEKKKLADCNIFDFINLVFRNGVPSLSAVLSEIEGAQLGHNDFGYLSFCKKILQKELEYLLEDNGVLLFPTFTSDIPFHYQQFIDDSGYDFTAILSALDFSVTQVPVRLDNGFPIGLQIVAAKDKEYLCFVLARMLEAEFDGWICPGDLSNYKDIYDNLKLFDKNLLSFLAMCKLIGFQQL